MEGNHNVTKGTEKITIIDVKIPMIILFIIFPLSIARKVSGIAIIDNTIVSPMEKATSKREESKTLTKYFFSPGRKEFAEVLPFRTASEIMLPNPERNSIPNTPIMISAINSFVIIMKYAAKSKLFGSTFMNWVISFG
jgi:hypothetical protein